MNRLKQQSIVAWEVAYRHEFNICKNFLPDVPRYKERHVIKSKVPLQIGKEGP